MTRSEYVAENGEYFAWNRAVLYSLRLTPAEKLGCNLIQKRTTRNRGLLYVPSNHRDCVSHNHGNHAIIFHKSVQARTITEDFSQNTCGDYSLTTWVVILPF